MSSEYSFLPITEAAAEAELNFNAERQILIGRASEGTVELPVIFQYFKAYFAKEKMLFMAYPEMFDQERAPSFIAYFDERMKDCDEQKVTYSLLYSLLLQRWRTNNELDFFTGYNNGEITLKQGHIVKDIMDEQAQNPMSSVQLLRNEVSGLDQAIGLFQDALNIPRTDPKTMKLGYASSSAI